MKTNQIKSKNRVRDFGEVFTAEREVKSMCDLIPEETASRIDSIWLEPACGNGNFVIEILERKLNFCKNSDDVMTVLKSIYAIDILADNVKETKARMWKIIKKNPFYSAEDAGFITLILNCNIQQGDFLTKKKSDGKELKFLRW